MMGITRPGVAVMVVVDEKEKEGGSVVDRTAATTRALVVVVLLMIATETFWQEREEGMGRAERRCGSSRCDGRTKFGWLVT